MLRILVKRAQRNQARRKTRRNRIMKRAYALRGAFISLSAIMIITLAASGVIAADQGALTIIEPDGKAGEGCPLEHTSVKAEVSGFVARVSVTQTFRNPRKQKVEAIYTFPLSAEAAVDEMVMQIGDRIVRGTIHRREEARRIYEQARASGHVASLLDQERPNIFTQSVANIMPGEKVVITIAYSEILPYDDGAFKFVFPMVVGPRFIPGAPTGRQGTGWAPDTTAVPDASRITPPVTPEGARAGHDIDLTVSIDAGVPILAIGSALHDVETVRESERKAAVSLKNRKEIPNRDFVLTYSVAAEEIRSGVLIHKEGPEGYVAVIMIPPKQVKPEKIGPREMIFVIDCSGSQRGKPLEQAKAAMRYFIAHMGPEDTFNIIDFNVSARALFTEPKRNTASTRAKALAYLSSLEANGGTWMGPAIEEVCKRPAPENRLRIVSFMTDGYVGNDFEIISMVKKLRGKSRWFPFGTGNSVNRFLLDTMARVGGGEVEYILLNSPGEEVARKFYQRIAEPVLTDIGLSVKDLELQEVFPESASDLWARKPIILKARYTKPGKGTLTLKGFSGGKPYEERIEVTLPETESPNPSLGALWARSKVDALMDQDWLGAQQGAPSKEVKEEIVKVALAHRIMTQFTSFVAVEETVVTADGQPIRVTVPVEMPDGVSREGVFGEVRQMPASAVPLAHRESAAMSPYLSRPQRGAESKARRLLDRLPFGMSKNAPVEQEVYEEARKKAGKIRKDDAGAHEADAELSNDLRKLASDLTALLEAHDKGEATPQTLLERVRIIDGKVLVQVEVTRASEELLKKLEKIGFKPLFKASTGTAVVGTIAVEKLRGLAALDEVLSVKPGQVG